MSDQISSASPLWFRPLVLASVCVNYPSNHRKTLPDYVWRDVSRSCCTPFPCAAAFWHVSATSQRIGWRCDGSSNTRHACRLPLLVSFSWRPRSTLQRQSYTCDTSTSPQLCGTRHPLHTSRWRTVSKYQKLPPRCVESSGGCHESHALGVELVSKHRSSTNARQAPRSASIAGVLAKSDKK